MSEIKNAIITSADLSMRDHGVLRLCLVIEGEGWGCVLGGRVLGHGYLGADHFDGSPKGIEEIMRIMDVVGVDQFSDLKGKYIRVADDGLGSTIEKFGNIIEDKWFDYEEFYSNREKGDEQNN